MADETTRVAPVSPDVLGDGVVARTAKKLLKSFGKREQEAAGLTKEKLDADQAEFKAEFDKLEREES